jgi:hypothetical protein
VIVWDLQMILGHFDPMFHADVARSIEAMNAAEIAAKDAEIARLRAEINGVGQWKEPPVNHFDDLVWLAKRTRERFTGSHDPGESALFNHANDVLTRIHETKGG